MQKSEQKGDAGFAIVCSVLSGDTVFLKGMKLFCEYIFSEFFI